MRGEMVALTLEYDMAVMKRFKRASMPDRDRGSAF
jgi:hypothetical protein